MCLQDGNYQSVGTRIPYASRSTHFAACVDSNRNEEAGEMTKLNAGKCHEYFIRNDKCEETASTMIDSELQIGKRFALPPDAKFPSDHRGNSPRTANGTQRTIQSLADGWCTYQFEFRFFCGTNTCERSSCSELSCKWQRTQHSTNNIYLFIQFDRLVHN